MLQISSGFLHLFLIYVSEKCNSYVLILNIALKKKVCLNWVALKRIGYRIIDVIKNEHTKNTLRLRKDVT